MAGGRPETTCSSRNGEPKASRVADWPGLGSQTSWMHQGSPREYGETGTANAELRQAVCANGWQKDGWHRKFYEAAAPPPGKNLPLGACPGSAAVA